MQHAMDSDSSADIRVPSHFLGLVSAELGEQHKLEATVAVREGVVQMADILRAIETALMQPGAGLTQLARTDGMRFIVDEQPEVDFLPLGIAGSRLRVRLNVTRMPRVLWESALQAAQSLP